MPASTDKKYAIVTGAGSGLGRAFCLRLASEGWHVGVTDVDLAAAEKTCATLAELGGSGQAELLDVTSYEAWQGLIDRLRSEWPQLDLLVNNAGRCGAGEVGESSLDAFQAVVDVNLYGVLYGCQAAVPWLKASAPGGHLVNVASVFGLVAAPTMAAYNTSKAAVVALSETLYGELRPLGVGVTVVAPGFFASELVKQGHFATDEQRRLAEVYVDNAQITADEVVEHAMRAIRRQQLYVVLGSKARWIWRLKRWMPARFARMIAWGYRRKLRKTLGGD